MDDDIYEEIWNAEWEYNHSLTQRKNNYILTDEQKVEYERLLDVGDNGIMGYVEIPSIKCALPVYHGTDETVMQIAVGHLEWSDRR